MTTWTKWEVVRHRVSTWGRVLDAHHRPIAGVLVSLYDRKDAQARLAAVGQHPASGADDLRRRIARGETRWDGIYFFLDLPPGHYKITVGDAGSGGPGEQIVSVRARDDERVEAAAADFVVGGTT